MRDYQKTIMENCEKNTPVKWWPKFAYHYTDVTNVVSIISSGNLYCRDKASAFNLMKNDNASKQIIEITNSNVTSNIRFYFRPLTPTQFHNEGFKHPGYRYLDDKNANTPVPVFLLFDLNKLLSLEGTSFSELSQAGHGTQTLSGRDAFSELDFKKIYSNGISDDDILKYRHAEILYPDNLRIDNLIRNILCRNSVERLTLLQLLRDASPEKYNKYKEIIKVYPSDTFYRNGLYIENVLYFCTKPLLIKGVTRRGNATRIQIRISFEGSIMCMAENSLLDNETI